MAKRGIDISCHQTNIDLSALKSKIDFVIIRVGYGVAGTIDKYFKRNVELCKELKIPVGFYWYSYALNVDGAKKEASHFVDAIASYKDICKYGAWYDMEDADGYKSKKGMPSSQVLKEMCVEFCKIVEQAGFYTGVYASESWFKNQLKGPELNAYDKWVAQWPAYMGTQRGLAVKPEARTNLSMWQFTSCGRFDEYDGNLDVNYAYKDFPNPNLESGEDETTSVPNPEPIITSDSKFKIGDKVIINGALYKSSNDTVPAGIVSNKVTNITRYEPGATHPYNTTDDLGWMSENTIKSYSEEALIVKGTKVRFNGTRSYSGIRLAEWTKGDVFDVIEVSGDRIVIGKGTVVTAAVNIKYCERI